MTTATRKDMTAREFAAALKRRGWRETGFLGYVSIPHADGQGSLQICKLNAGSNRRAQIAYLIAEARRLETDERQLKGT